MQIVNTIATITLDRPLDLVHLHQNIKGSEQGKSHWLKYRLQPENQYVAFYKSGKFLLTGKTVMNDLDGLVNRVHNLITDAGIITEIKEVNVSNIVAQSYFPLQKGLEAILQRLSDENEGTCEYEPEQFPGLNYKNWGVSFLLFSSGKFIITGAKTKEQLEAAEKNFTELLGRI